MFVVAWTDSERQSFNLMSLKEVWDVSNKGLLDACDVAIVWMPPSGKASCLFIVRQTRQSVPCVPYPTPEVRSVSSGPL